MVGKGNISDICVSCRYMRSFVLLTLFLLYGFQAYSQSSVLRSFAETGGSVSTGMAGDIGSFSNGDVLVANERWTNFSQKGIQLFRLEEIGLGVLNSKAYFNDFTITNIRVAVRNDTVFILAQHSNGGIDKLLFMVFDSDLSLLRSKIIEGDNTDTDLYAYSFFASDDGSFRVFGNRSESGTNPQNNRFVLSLDANGGVLWKFMSTIFAPFWGGSVLLPNGSLVGTSKGDAFVVDKNGNLAGSIALGNEFSYTLNGAMSKSGDAMFCRAGYDSAAYYAVRISPSAKYAGITASTFSQAPVFFEVLQNGSSVIASSSFAGDEVHLKLSFFDNLGVFIRSISVNNVYGYAPTGALRDACRYSSHVDANGNLLILGVSNRKGFFVLRYNTELGFDCGYETSATQPSPVPEVSGVSYPAGSYDVKVSDYPFQEEQAGIYKPECSACGSALYEPLFDTTLCLDDLEFVLDAKNTGSKYLWSDGSVGQTLRITQSGKYWVQVSNDCDTLRDSLEVTLLKRPKAQLSFSPDAPLPGEPIQIAALPDTLTFMNWYRMDTLFTQEASFSWTSNQNGVYQFVWEAYDDPSCRARDSISIKVSLVDYYFPTAFSPNGNKLNDTWGPVGSGIETYTVRIINRWGQIVYEGENRNWDGTFKGQAMTAGLYSYIVELYDSDGIRHEHKGTITLVH